MAVLKPQALLRSELARLARSSQHKQQKCREQSHRRQRGRESRQRESHSSSPNTTTTTSHPSLYHTTPPLSAHHHHRLRPHSLRRHFFHTLVLHFAAMFKQISTRASIRGAALSSGLQRTAAPSTTLLQQRIWQRRGYATETGMI